MEIIDTVWDEIKQEYIVKPVKKWIQECGGNSNPVTGGCSSGIGCVPPNRNIETK